MNDVTPISTASSSFSISLIWNVLHTLVSVCLVLGVPLAFLWGLRLSREMQDAWYVPTFLMMAQGALLLIVAPTALLHSQKLKQRGVRPEGLVRTLFVVNAIATACTFGYLAWGAIAVFA